MRYLQEFPDYPEPLPQIDGFEDISYRNDICPSLGKQIKPDVWLTLFCDYPNFEDRETGGKRYAFFVQDDGADDYLFTTDDLESMKHFINGFLKGLEQ